MPCVIPNPDFNPPTIGELFTRLDSLTGCGDLMFSSHTIYTVSLILTIWKYWPNKYGITIMVCVQIIIAFLIVASRKHYTLDVFSALYIVPLFWLVLEAYHKDINSKDSEVTVKTIYDFYGLTSPVTPTTARCRSTRAMRCLPRRLRSTRCRWA